MSSARSTTATTAAAASSINTAPTAKYLQSRISHLSLQLLKRYNALLSAAADTSSSSSNAPLEGPDESAGGSQAVNAPPPSAIETVSAQIDIEVESQAIIRAAEEIMVLTRGLKELWLFGGLNTVEGEEARKEKERRQRELKEEVEGVREGLREWFAERLRGEEEGKVVGRGAAEVAG